jgi:hypothetical protein
VAPKVTTVQPKPAPQAGRSASAKAALTTKQVPTAEQAKPQSRRTRAPSKPPVLPAVNAKTDK